MTWTIPPRSEGPSGIALSRTGNGPAVVLIHGVGLRAECWARQVPALADRYTVIAVDLPGHGCSAAFGTAPMLGDYASRIAAAVEPVGGAAVFVGHSLGALIALEVAFRYPALAAGVAALNAIYRRSPEAAEAVKARANALAREGAGDPSQTLRRWFGADPHSSAEAACRDWLRAADPSGYAAAYAVFATTDGPADDDLRALACPALFLTGALEPNSTPAMSEAMAAMAPMGAGAVIAGAAHMMPMTHSTAVNAALLEFVGQCHGRRI